VQFFRGNRRVCEEWFARLRPSLLRAAAAAGSPHLVYEHAARRLPDLLRLLAKVSPLLHPSPYCIHHLLHPSSPLEPFVSHDGRH